MTAKKVYTGEEQEQAVEVASKELKKPANVLDLLLGSDINIIEMPKQEVELKRLSEKFGAPFIVVCEALSQDKYEEVQDLAIEVNGKDFDINMNLLQTFIVIEGVRDQSGNLLFKNKDLMSKFKAPTPKELVRKLILSGELTGLYTTISNLSGFGNGAVEEVKN